MSLATIRRTFFLPLPFLVLSCASAAPEPQTPAPVLPTVSDNAAAPATTATANAPPPTQATPPPPCALASGADACQVACDEGDVPSCRNLGLLIQQGKAGRRNEGRLVMAFRKACDANDPEGCDALASQLGEGAPSVALHRKACDAGYMPACGHLAGLLLVNGDREVVAEKEPDIAAAVALAQKACDGGHPNACTILGSVYRKGKPAKKDHKAAKQYLERACNMGDYRGCAIGGTMYELGWDGEKPNEERSRQLRRKAFELVQKLCTDKLESCHILAEYHADGFGTKEDPAREVEVLRAACDRGHPGPCVILGIKMEGGRGVPKDIQAAAELYRRGCEDGEGAGCYRLANLHATGNGFPKDEQRIASLLSQSCDLGFLPSCIWLAVKLKSGDGVPKDFQKALTLHRLACSRRANAGCGGLAVLLLGTDEHGIPRKEAQAEALAALTFGCDKTEAALDCHQLAWIHDLGVGVPKNPVRAKEMAQKACDFGERPSCAWVKDRARVPQPVWVDFVKETKK
jgi:hypothetical protein